MPGPKLNNDRKYPDANHQPRHLARLRKEDAKKRQEAYDKLTTQQKLDLINEKLPNGANRQRARLEAKLKKEQEKKTAQASAPQKDAAKPNANQQNKKEGK